MDKKQPIRKFRELRLPVRPGHRLRCECGRPDPAVARTLERTPEVLVQILKCPDCGRRWHHVAD
jgi:hypothetical protein